MYVKAEFAACPISSPEPALLLSSGTGKVTAGSGNKNVTCLKWAISGLSSFHPINFDCGGGVKLSLIPDQFPPSPTPSPFNLTQPGSAGSLGKLLVAWKECGN